MKSYKNKKQTKRNKTTGLSLRIHGRGGLQRQGCEHRDSCGVYHISQAKHASGSILRTILEMVRNDRVLDLFRRYSPGANSSEEVKALLIWIAARIECLYQDGETRWKRFWAGKWEILFMRSCWLSLWKGCTWTPEVSTHHLPLPAHTYTHTHILPPTHSYTHSSTLTHLHRHLHTNTPLASALMDFSQIHSQPLQWEQPFQKDYEGKRLKDARKKIKTIN